MTYFNYLRYGTIALGIVVVIAAVLIILAARKKRKSGKKTKLPVTIAHGAVGIIALVLIFVANSLTTTYASSINAVMTYNGATEDDADLESWKELAYDIEEEGITLLENNDSVLPLAEGTKVNLLGYVAYNPIYSGEGSGSVSASDSVSFTASLEAAGIEINPAVLESGIYGTTEEDTGEDSSIGFSTSSFSIDEVSIDSYTGDVSFESLAEYSDIAILVFGRTGSEGADLTDYEDGDYLELNQNELDLLSAAREAFGTVIVVVNSGNALEMGWVDEYDVDAVLWVGLPGPYGLEAFGRIITGETNPSGHLSDTWVYDNNSNPANENFGEQLADGTDDRYYVDYVEGIYVGYKWYETAYAEGAVVTNTKTGDTYDYANDYDAIVAYPFGYGLSYTTFAQTIVGGLEDGDALSATGSVSIEVEVTNTGDVAGKEVVQLYVTVPYTDYDKENLVEKSEVTLVAYDKTDVLEPGESEIITIEFNVEDIASYDSSCDNGDGTYGAYMLDEGEYVFSVRSDAHTELDSVSAVLEEQYFFSGENGRSSDEQTAYNQFDDAARGEYLSRQDGFANYESAMNSVSSTVESTDYAYTDNLYDESLDDIEVSYTEGVDYGADGDLTLADMEGLDYDDELWEELLNQLSIEDLLALTGSQGETNYASPALESIDKTATTDSDGPLGISSMYSSDMLTVAFPCVPILSATFNDDLAYEMGSCVADQAEVNGVTCWYAPAMDTHRSAYGGRNFEYYSEDATLAAGMAAAEVSGATDKGLITVIKHFALNDQETNRDSVHTYSNEQAIREIYLRPFESAIKNGGAQAIMNSMNYIGDTYSGGHVGLLTEVTRNEWGFQGFILTDMDQAGEIRSYWATIRAGVDCWLCMAGIDEATAALLGIEASDPVEVRSDEDIYYLRQAAHHILYTFANNRTFGSTILNWQLYRTIIYVELVVLAAACLAAILLRRRKKDVVSVEA